MAEKSLYNRIPYARWLRGRTDSVRTNIVSESVSLSEPEPLAPLLPTLQSWEGMVMFHGKPTRREPFLLNLDAAAEERLCRLRSAYRNVSINREGRSAKKWEVDPEFDTVEENLKACSLPVTKEDLLEYMRHGKRIDVEQAVGMLISYLSFSLPVPYPEEHQDLAEPIDDFEKDAESVLLELLRDESVQAMLHETHMWREEQDSALFTISSSAAIQRQYKATSRKNKIITMLNDRSTETGDGNDSAELFASSSTLDADLSSALQSIRRKREKLNNSQHLVMPDTLIPVSSAQISNQEDTVVKQWTHEQSYRRGLQTPLVPPSNDSSLTPTMTRVMSRRKFSRIQRLLNSMLPPRNTTRKYIHDVQTLQISKGITSPQRLGVLEKTTDAYAVAYGFLAYQRKRQLKIISDKAWTRFLIKGEGALILQNRSDITTSVEDILIRHADDLVALTAIKCPTGLREHFSDETEIKARAREVCELMERYVDTFGGGDFKELTFYAYVPSGSGRGPVDWYNALCDELRDCCARAKALGLDLGIGPVYKFLAKDVMSWNNGWKDDAFAGGKIPGWVEYLARVRAEDTQHQA